MPILFHSQWKIYPGPFGSFFFDNTNGLRAKHIRKTSVAVVFLINIKLCIELILYYHFEAVFFVEAGGVFLSAFLATASFLGCSATAGLRSIFFDLITFLTIWCSSIRNARRILLLTQVAQRDPP